MQGVPATLQSSCPGVQSRSCTTQYAVVRTGAAIITARTSTAFVNPSSFSRVSSVRSVVRSVKKHFGGCGPHKHSSRQTRLHSHPYTLTMWKLMPRLASAEENDFAATIGVSTPVQWLLILRHLPCRLCRNLAALWLWFAMASTACELQAIASFTFVTLRSGINLSMHSLGSHSVQSQTATEQTIKTPSLRRPKHKRHQQDHHQVEENLKQQQRQ